jgi:hypothetical protein
MSGKAVGTDVHTMKVIIEHNKRPEQIDALEVELARWLVDQKRCKFAKVEDCDC